MTEQKGKITTYIITFVMIIITLLTFNIYKNNSLAGDLNNHILASDNYPMPEEIEKRGIQPYFTLKQSTGWDGQFHYYIANDVFALKDTKDKMGEDNASYRYSRVGFSLFTNILSKITFRDWVSPLFYLCTYLLLFFAAVFTFSNIVIKRNKSVYLSLIWILFAGNMLTMFNALTDCASDCFFILSLPFLFSFCENSSKHKYVNGILFILFASFAALSREVYCLFIFALWISAVYETIKNKKTKWGGVETIIIASVPAIIYILWKIYVYIHIGSSEYNGIGGYPFVSIIKYMFNGYDKINSYLIPLFLLVLLSSVYIGVIRLKENKDIITNTFALSLIFIPILYVCLGDVVMFNWTGYIKVLGSLYILIALSINLKNKPEKAILIIIIISLLCTTYIYIKNKVSIFYMSDRYFQMMNYDYKDEIEKEKTEINCFNNYEYESKILDYELKKVGSKDILIVHALIKNKTPYIWKSTNEKGGVIISGFWLIGNNQVRNGLETYIYPEMKPNEEREFYIFSKLPNKKHLKNNELKYVITPVQNQCAQMYKEKNTEVQTIEYKDIMENK